MNVHIQDPKVSLDNFDYIVAPEHDGLEGKNVLTTQLYIHDHPQNKKDFLFQRMSLAEKRINSMKLIPAADKNTAEFQTFVKIVV